MKAKFNIKEGLTAQRETVINKYNMLTGEEFFDGCTLKQFMLEVMNMCVINRIASETTLKRMLPIFLGDIYFSHSKVSARDAKTETMKKNMPNQQWAALV